MRVCRENRCGWPNIFPVTAVGAKAIPFSAKYSTLAAGIPLATRQIGIFAVDPGDFPGGQRVRGLSKSAEENGTERGGQKNFRCRRQIQLLAASQK
jgi:hypothetical protein